MKTLRIWLLIFLAVLLPIRGAVAAAVMCPPVASPIGTVAPATPAHDHASMSGASAAHHHAQPHAAPDSPVTGHHADAVDAVEKCGLCCEMCSVTPLLGAVHAVPSPPMFSAAPFPDLGAAAPSFISDGQERPPRGS